MDIAEECLRSANSGEGKLDVDDLTQVAGGGFSIVHWLVRGFSGGRCDYDTVDGLICTENE